MIFTHKVKDKNKNDGTILFEDVTEPGVYRLVNDCNGYIVFFPDVGDGMAKVYLDDFSTESLGDDWDGQKLFKTDFNVKLILKSP